MMTTQRCVVQGWSKLYLKLLAELNNVLDYPDGTGFDGMRAARFKGLWTVAGLALCKSREGTDESTASVAEETPGLKGS